MHQLYLLEQKWGSKLAADVSKDFLQWRKSLENKMRQHIITKEERSVVQKINELIQEESTFHTTSWSRQLGFFHCIRINLKDEIVSCNCELYHFSGICLHTRIMKLIEFNKLPPTDCMGTNGTNWSDVRNHYKTSFHRTIFQHNSDNILEKQAHKYCHVRYPSLDPNNLD